jgi:hypothetical protein
MAEQATSHQFALESLGEMSIVRLRFFGTQKAEALALGRLNGCTRFVVDYRSCRATDTTAETYFHIANLEELGVTRSDRVAVVYGRDVDRHVFAELVAQNRGWANMRYFTSMPTAEEWLQSA